MSCQTGLNKKSLRQYLNAEQDWKSWSINAQSFSHLYDPQLLLGLVTTSNQSSSCLWICFFNTLFTQLLQRWRKKNQVTTLGNDNTHILITVSKVSSWHYQTRQKQIYIWILWYVYEWHWWGKSTNKLTPIENQSYSDLLIALFITSKIQRSNTKVLLHSVPRAVSNSKILWHWFEKSTVLHKFIWGDLSIRAKNNRSWYV